MTTTGDLRAILAEVRSIAVVGLSANPLRPSHDVTCFLRERGYDCVGVNPGLAGRLVAGVPVVGRLADLPHSVDMIDIFRASEHVDGIVEEALRLPSRPGVIWMQLGITDAVAADRAEAAGLTVVMDACPKIVLARG